MKHDAGSMKKKLLTFLFFVFLLLTAPQSAIAQQTACAVLSSDIKPYHEAMTGFKQAFRGEVEEMILGDDPDRAGEIADKISRSQCAVIVAMGSNALKFVKLRAAEKPIVFAMTLSPAATELAARNITGVFLDPSPKATLAAIKKVLPAANKVGVLYSRSASGDYLDDARRASAGLGITIVTAQAGTVGDAVRQIPTLMTQCDVMLMIPDSVTASQGAFEAMLSASLKGNVPIFALSQKHVSEGALAALASDYTENGKQAAEISHRVASGTAPSSIPYEAARKAGFVINMKAAKRMGITISPQVLTEAVEVYR